MRANLALLLVIAGLACVESEMEPVSSFGYIAKYGIPKADEIRKTEKELDNSRIVGGSAANQGQFPFQAGLISELFKTSKTTICGGSLISNVRVLTAAHCLNDGVQQIKNITVVLGSTRLFSGGTRIKTAEFVKHPDYNPKLAKNDVAIIYLHKPVIFSDMISPVVLPRGSLLLEDFVDNDAIAVGFGRTGDKINININQMLRYLDVRVISNDECSKAFKGFIKPSIICIAGQRRKSPCMGDSGGPLLVYRNNRLVQIGVFSFTSNRGCEIGQPAGYSRVSSFLDFIGLHLSM